MLVNTSMRTGFWLAAWVFVMLGLGPLGRALHFGQWMDALPFAYQVAAKIAFVLLFTVVPVAVGIAIIGRRKNA
jgi:hypothetical protein